MAAVGRHGSIRDGDMAVGRWLAIDEGDVADKRYHFKDAGKGSLSKMARVLAIVGERGRLNRAEAGNFGVGDIVLAGGGLDGGQHIVAGLESDDQSSGGDAGLHALTPPPL